MSIDKICKVSNCNRIGVYIKKSNDNYLIKGYCSMHYQRYRKGKDMLAPIRTSTRKPYVHNDMAIIPLDESESPKVATADKDNLNKLSNYKWSESYYGYAVANIIDNSGRRTQVKMHHLVAGKPPKGMVIDHINRDKLDNRRENLRTVGYSVNTRNRTFNKSKAIPYKGVYKSRDKYEAKYSLDGKVIRIGRFETIIEAKTAYEDAIIEQFGEAFY